VSDASTDRRPGGSARIYVVDVDGESMTVDVVADGVRIGGVLLAAELVDIPGVPIRVLRVGDAVYEVVARRAEGRGAYALVLEGVRLHVEALDERARAVRSLSAAAIHAGPEVVRAPMPGLIVRVLIAPGDTVRAGDGLVVMEAMKMENELRAKGPGKVRTVSASVGTPVEKGAILIELE
jgi:biotin carboxyl carrier protein